MHKNDTPEKVASTDELRHLPEPDFLLDGGSLRCYCAETVEKILAAERERWRGFTAHCQCVVAALKARMTAEQVVAHLDAELAQSIDRMTSADTSDLDPDLVEWASRVLWPTVACSDISEPGLT